MTNFNTYYVSLWVVVTNNFCHFILPVLVVQTLEVFPTPLRASVFGMSQACRSAGSFVMSMSVNLVYTMSQSLPFTLFTLLSIIATILTFQFKYAYHLYINRSDYSNRPLDSVEATDKENDIELSNIQIPQKRRKNFNRKKNFTPENLIQEESVAS
jgi:hypothetical protein